MIDGNLLAAADRDVQPFQVMTAARKIVHDRDRAFGPQSTAHGKRTGHFHSGLDIVAADPMQSWAMAGDRSGFMRSRKRSNSANAGTAGEPEDKS